MLGSLASANVPDVMDVAAIAATLNVPKPTRSRISPEVAPDATTTDVSDVIVTTVPFTNFTPLR